jgi:dUTP pyrophosphatase
MAIPEGYAGLIWPRSGTAVKAGLDVLAGVVDSGYRGEVCVVLQNHSDTDYTIKKGDRAAQMLIQKVGCVTVLLVSSLDETDRGTGGFGSTGK